MQKLINPKNCYTVDSFYKLLEGLDASFDCNGSLMVGTLNLKNKDGVFYRCGTFVDFCKSYNTNFKDVLDIKKSFLSGKCFYIFLKEEEVVKEDVEEVVEVVHEVVEPLIVEEPIKEAETMDVVETITPDWKKAGKLPTKVKLEEYAREFGVELNRSNTLSNMLKDFKIQIEAK